ncbi:MAG: Uma2 family endonuclease [Gemmatimonadota bacterium]
MVLSQITWQDVQQMPDDGVRREAIGGDLYASPVPPVRHQEICVDLMVALDRIVTTGGHGTLLPGPIGVEFPATREGVQPDIVFVHQARVGIIGEDWIRGAPDLVVEIVSPSTEERDRGVKLRLYWRQGVPEYWIVDPEAEEVEIWGFRGEQPVSRRVTDRVPVNVDGETVGEIDLAEVFRQV